MDFCTPLFGRPLSDLTLQDVQAFFQTNKAETDQLEFKSFAGTLAQSYPGLVRSLCGFLNSKGGLLIWGAPQGVIPQGATEKIFVGALVPVDTVLGKDQLISKCSDTIVPLPNAIRVKVIESGAGGCVCVFEVDESEYSPHQVSGTYLMRLDGQTRPAPHHYIEALFKKIRYPNLEGYIKPGTLSIHANNYRLAFELFFFNWSPLQNEENFGFRLLSPFGFFPAAQTNPQRYANNGHEYRFENYKTVFHFGEPLHEAQVILINPHQVPENHHIDLVLTFGGKYSPTKMSHYELNLSDLNVQGNALIFSKIENELSKDGQERKGATRESILQIVLER